jgi:hypothetical protein
MSAKIDKEAAAIEAEEKKLADRKRKLAEMKREEQQKTIDRLVKKLKPETAIAILERSAELKGPKALERLKD